MDSREQQEGRRRMGMNENDTIDPSKRFHILLFQPFHIILNAEGKRRDGVRMDDEKSSLSVRGAIILHTYFVVIDPPRTIFVAK